MTFSPPTPALTAPKRPTRLTTVLVFLWVIEGLVACFAVYTLLVLGLQLVVGPLNSLPPGHPAAGYQAQLFWSSLPLVQLPVHCAQLALSIALVALAIQTFRGRPAAAARLRPVLGAAMAVVGLKLLVTVFIQYRVMGIMPAYMDAVLSTGPTAPPREVRAIVDTALAIGSVLGVVVNVVIAAAKVTLYVIAHRTLARPEIRAYLEAPASGAQS